MGNVNNQCSFEGRIVRDIDYSSFTVNDQNGQRQVSKARFSIAVDRPLSKQQRQAAQNPNSNIKTADFIPLSATGAIVDNILKPFFYRGKGIHVSCHYTEWQTKDQQTGQTKYGHSFEIDDIGFCIQDPKNANDNNNNGANNGGGGNQNYGGGQNYGGSNNNTNQNHSQQQAQAAAQNAGFSMFDEDSQPF